MAVTTRSPSGAPSRAPSEPRPRTTAAKRTTRAPQREAQAPGVQSTPPPPPSAMAAGSSRDGWSSDRRFVLGAAIAMLIVCVASLTVRAVNSNIDVTGDVMDARTHSAITGAHIVAMNVHARTDGKGTFHAMSVHRGTTLRVSADNYRYADVQASGEMHVMLRPIPVTGKITSAFTSQGIGATIHGAQDTTSKSDGTFTAYGNGPGDSITITAFGHAPLTATIPASRVVDVSLKLGRVDPKSLIKPVTGYGFVDVPGTAVQAMRAEIAASDPDIAANINGIEMRSITKGGKGVGFVIVVAVDPSYAALPGFQDAFFDGFSSGSQSHRDIHIGKTRVRFAQGDGITGYAWQRFSGFVSVLGESPADMKTIAENMIGAKTAVPTEAI